MSARASNIEREQIETIDVIDGLTLSSRKTVSALNGRIGSDILIPPYQRIIETDYLPPRASHWTEECWPVDVEELAEDFPDEKIFQPRRLPLRLGVNRTTNLPPLRALTILARRRTMTLPLCTTRTRASWPGTKLETRPSSSTRWPRAT